MFNMVEVWSASRKRSTAARLFRSAISISMTKATEGEKVEQAESRMTEIELFDTGGLPRPTSVSARPVDDSET